MSLSLSKKNVLSIMAMTLAMISLISPAEAQKTCTSTSPECCWVVESWKSMGKNTTVSPTSATACCSGLPGVGCTSTGKVIYINWASKSLKGQIPSSLGNLKDLAKLLLDNNQLSGSIPSSIGNLVKLKDLFLYRNQLSGSIPPEIGNLTNLQRLILGYNQLSGSIPTEIGRLKSLQELYLDNNQLEGQIPSSLGNLDNLERLWLDNNQLSGSIPSSIGNLVKLKDLFLYRNQLSGSIPPEIGNLTNLQRLYLGYNQLSGSIPTEIGRLKSLQELYLRHNQLSGSIPSSLGNLVNLEVLDLSNNAGLTGTLTLQCGTNVQVLGTDVTVCGCVSESTPPALYPPPEIDVDCLASRHALSLSKRSQVYGQVVAKIDNLIFKCHVDAKKNPFADCTNSMAALCDPARTFYNKSTCKTAVNQMYGQMSEYWQEVRKACGRWPFTQSGITYTGVYPSENCATANSDLIENAYYTVWNPLTNAYEKIKVSSELTDSTNVRLWGQVAE